MSRLGDIGAKLHRGEIGYDFVGKRRLWYGVSILITILAFAGLGVRGLHMGVEFEGGAVFTTEATDVSVERAREVAEEASGSQALVQSLGNDGSLRIQVSGLDTDQSNITREALAEELGVPTQELNAELVGPSWGSQIANKAWQGLAIFMVLVVIYLAIAFEWRMAMAALIALIHDLTITVGVYALVGFEVTPGTVIGLLTILGYSLYDTVVVFDGLKETTKNFSKQTNYTYGELANRSLNATLVRSINTSVVALLPVAALLFIGGGVLGGGMLNDIALSLFVGLTAGAYSSIVIATPMVADFKMHEPSIKAHDKKVLAKRAKREAEENTGTVSEAEADDPSQDAGDDESAAGAVVGPRRQPVSRSRGRNRPSGKRR
ncbi:MULTISPECIES: protein translocase subunit SecF [unclassified Streptomyces]|jgi:preprotein translocase subunit SecF|uniref:protein translocase subunit SecF n=1 Tax=Streptomyces TaxID=1883 RepID=UPI00190390EB|nr:MULTISPECIES: protein translocase subunit SecF [unclassified Streptomyces]MCU4749635.1 protein translocase subunit SecF [Streptomyces sp. G-5]QQN80556.1 protein translocase subunit SecF [Streptomyces sp. XC 2026]